jgi:drug/metabolite transporter (DMT)-like permease
MVYAMALAAVFGYGASSFLTKIAVTGADGLAVGMLRAIVAMPVAFGLIAIYRLRLPWRGKRKWLLLISGIGGLALFPILFSLGLRATTAGHATTASACGAVVAGVIMALVDRRWPSWTWWAGTVVGLSGAMLLIWEAIGLDIAGVTWQGDALVFSGMVVGVAGYVAGSRLAREVGAVAVTMWSVVAAGVLLLPALAWYADRAMLAAIPPTSWAATATLAWGVTIGAYVLWTRALADGGIARVGSMQLLQPVFGITLALLVLGEPVTPLLAVATVIAIAGVALVQRSR